MIGVADGVGGWRQYGVDPGLFSSNLMKVDSFDLAIFNRPGVAGAVLQTPPSLTHSLIN